MISKRTRGSPRTNKYTEIHLWLGQLSCELLVLLTACKYTEQGGLLVYSVIFITFCPPESREPGGSTGL